MESFSIPEAALAAYENLSRLRVTVHDLEGTLWPFLPPERFQHMHPLCVAVKVRHDRACVDFGVKRLRREIPTQPHGRVQVCHAGLVELVAPVFREGRLVWVLFAGPRRAGNLPNAVRDTTPPPARTPWARGTPLPTPLDEAEAQALLEALRQLAARLRLWREELEGTGLAPKQLGPNEINAPPDALATRRAQVLRFIQLRHTQQVRLADLAKLLHLSETRAGHAVREACGESFVKLLLEARLRTAAGVLRHTSAPVPEAALRAGFGDLSYFHRAFRKRFGKTPRQYCRGAETP